MDIATDMTGEMALTGAMHRRNVRLRLYLLLIVVDVLAIALGFLAAGQFREGRWLSLSGVDLAYPVLPVYLMIATATEAYGRDALTSGTISMRRALVPLAITFLAFMTLIFFLQVGPDLSRVGLAIGMGASAFFIATLRLIVVFIVRRTAAPTLVAELLIVDDLTRSEWTEDKQSDTVFAAEAEIEPDLNNPYMLHRFAELLSKYERVVVRCRPERQHDWALLMRGASIDGEILTSGFGSLGVLGLADFKGRQTLVVARGPLSYSDMAKKRLLDLAITLPLVLLLLPAMLIIGLAVKLDSPGPILFRQDRIGRGNRIFKVLKFRSMRTEKLDAAGATSTQRDDKRITRVGRFIRKTSIDELPQLLNVLKGDMSLVGPRPHALGSLAGGQLFWEVDRDYWHRHALKPGITGLAQVRGFRGATHRDVDLKNRLRADLEYLHDWSLARDVSILFRTAAVLVHRNAY
jgi:exopolysaccharide biosynthesis polyprenyl glycosylphosphotransferase